MDLPSIKSTTDRRMAYVALTLFTLGAMYGVYSFGRPVYWRFYATVIHPFDDPGDVDLALDDDPFAAAVLEQSRAAKHANLVAAGGGAAGTAVQQQQQHVKSDPVVAVKTPFSLDDYPLTKCGGTESSWSVCVLLVSCPSSGSWLFF